MQTEKVCDTIMMSIFKKNKGKNVEKNKINKDVEYTALTPIDDMPNGKEYLNALKWALSNKKIKIEW